MARKRRRFTAEFKARVALEALQERDSVQAIAARHELHPNQVSAWKRQLLDAVPEVFAKAGSGSSPRSMRRRSTTCTQDRRAHRRAGFFSARVEALSRAERVRMIEPEGPLSLSRQCVLLGVSRSSLYYRPKGERAENLALMRRMDELHMDYPFYGSRQMMRHLRREGVTAGRHRIRRLMAVMEMEATYRRPRTSVANSEHRILSLPAARPRDLPGRTSVVRGHHLYPCDARVFLPCGRDGLGDPARPLLAVVQHHGHLVLHRGSGRRAGPGQSGDPEYRPGLAVHQRGLRRAGAGCGCGVLDGRPGPVPRQHLHRTAVAVAEVRGGVPA